MVSKKRIHLPPPSLPPSLPRSAEYDHIVICLISVLNPDFSQYNEEIVLAVG